MKAAIISIGTEHLTGKIIDTNAVYISKELSNYSITIYARETLPDNKQIIADFIKQLLYKVDIIFTIAGLGPTHDDITKEAVSDVLKKKLIYKNEIWELIKNRFKTFNSIPTENNKKQAFVFENGRWYENKKGTAPGLYIYHNTTNTHFFLLPGPPIEFIWLFEEYIYKELGSICNIKHKIIRKILRIYNAGESRLASIINPIISEFKEIDLGIYVKQEGYIELDFHLTHYSDTNQINIFEKKIKESIQNAGFFITENEQIEAIIGNYLKNMGLTIGFAESITGGRIMANLVKIPGSSEYFKGGIVAYSNEVKTKLLNVRTDTLINHGAVSAECALEMAEGIIEKLDCDLGISITGIAGPTGDTPLKPIGLCYIGIRHKSGTKTEKILLSGTRQTIIIKAVNSIFIEIFKYLNI